jgi:ubiquinol-cytochrome c reductase cytochrome b subunit
MRVWNKSLLMWIVKASGIFYISPSNFNYWYNFGVLALYFLISQIITGIFLAMFYNASTTYAFTSIININNEIYFGWWIRALHSNGASWFFFIVYIHMAKGIYYASYTFPRQFLWISGVTIWVLMIATAFLGNYLPKMSRIDL